MQTRLFSPKYKFISLLFVYFLGVFLASCGTQSSADTNFSDEDPTGDQAVEVQDTPPNNESQARGLEMAHARTAAEFSFQDEFPNLYEILKEDADAVSAVGEYAGRVVTASGINAEEDILNLFQVREEKIMPLLQSILENLDPEVLNAKWEDLSGELDRLGMSMTSAEGMFTGLGKEPMMAQSIDTYGSEALKLYVQFEAANTQSMSGEYPYMDMSPYTQMVEIGEKINNLAPNIYVDKIRDRFQTALISLADVHFVKDPSARQDPQLYVGGTSTEAYPSISEKESVASFADEGGDSKYQKMMAEIMTNTSEISNRPENIYVIVVEWAETFDAAVNRVFTHLSEGEDVPHYLKIRTGDGKDKYAISYRFYEDADKADAALEKAKQDFPNAQMIFCSVKGNQLYQLGI